MQKSNVKLSLSLFQALKLSKEQAQKIKGGGAHFPGEEVGLIGSDDILDG